MKKSYFLILLSGALLVHLTTLFNNYLFNESAIYAQVAYNCVNNDDYINLTLNGSDWLGKPHLSFWIRSLFFSQLGYSVITYKMPTFFFLLLTVVYVYYTAKVFYGKNKAQISTLIFVSSAQIFVGSIYANNEIIVLCMTIATIYHLNKVLSSYTEVHLILAGLFSGLLVISNGILPLLVIYLAIGLYMYMNKNKLILEDVPWLFLAIATLLFILPEVYSLYSQFDLFPNKSIENHTNISGVRYFLLDDPFGRFFNFGLNTKKLDSQTLLFFLHSLFWCFAPWLFIGCMGLYKQGKKIFGNINVTEQLTFWCLIVLFLYNVLVQFHFSLYTSIIIPFLSIITANRFVNFLDETSHLNKHKILKIMIKHFYPLLFLLTIILLEMYFQTKYPYFAFISSSVIVGFMMVLILLDIKYKYLPFIYNYIAVISFFLYISLGVYPTISEYHSGVHAAAYCNEKYIRHKIISTEPTPLFAQQLHKPVKYVKSVDEVMNIVNIQNDTSNKATILYTNIHFVRALRKKNIDYTLMKSFRDYEGPIFNFTYLNRATRYKAIDLKYILQLD